MIFISIALLIGLSAATIVTLFRVVPGGKQLYATNKKPWACDICMSFWSTLLVSIVTICTDMLQKCDAWEAIPAYIVCLWMIQQTKEIRFFPKDKEE